MWVYLLTGSLLACVSCALIVYANQPLHEFPIGGERTEDEIALEKRGNLNTLHRYRYRVYRNTTSSSSALVQNILSTEEELRYIIQNGVYFKEGDTQETINYVHRQVYMFTMEYWRYRRELTGVLGRASDRWRSNPSWYMHRVLVADCVAKQGCSS
jgi:hypothetical protein